MLGHRTMALGRALGGVSLRPAPNKPKYLKCVECIKRPRQLNSSGSESRQSRIQRVGGKSQWGVVVGTAQGWLISSRDDPRVGCRRIRQGHVETRKAELCP